jgi:EAL domain-containing protein (putative c-di-GMP-specific phosphodiesterase class I)/putative methionine-R-sulfoxide reductase with GAF domain
MQRLIEALAASLDPVSLVRRAAEQMCVFTPAASGAGITLCDPSCSDNLVIVSAHGALAGLLGRVLPRTEAFQERALRSRSPQAVDDVLSDPRVSLETQALAASLGVRSWLVIPLIHNDTAIGAMSVVAGEAAAFDDATRKAIASMSDFVAALISSQSQLAELFDALDAQQEGDDHEASSAARFVASLMHPQHIENDRLYHRLDELFTPGALRPVFQPIADLSTRRVVAYEGLSRFPGAVEHDVQEWFRAARLTGRGIDLEVHAVRCILDAGRAIPADVPVAVNLSPFAAIDPGAQAVLLAAGRAVTVELTEHEPFPLDLTAALQPLRDAGIRIAVDDAGAGYSSFLQILRLQPDVIKIDAEFTAGVEHDPARRALTSAIVQLAREVDAVTVAEAIETESQLRAVRRLDVGYGQGYHLGRPDMVA